MAKAVSFLL